MKLFAKPRLKDEERNRCLFYHDEQLCVTAFLDRERRLFEDALGEHWPAMMESPLAAGEVCRASDRFRQAAQEALRRHTEIQPVPAAASKFHAAENSYLLQISAWAKANLAIMETLAQGRPPFYVRFERLKDQADSARQQAKETYWSFRRRLEPATNGIEALQTALNTHDFEDAGIDDWQPEPYAEDFRQAHDRILGPRTDGLKATVSSMTHHPAVGANPFLNLDFVHVDEALEIDPQDAAAWFNQGVRLAARDRYEEAIACYDKTLEIDPQDAAAWFNKGVNLAALDRREEAIACFDKALELDPQDATAWCAKGVNLATLGRQEEATGCWDRALQIDTNCVAAWCAKGVSLALLGRHEEAVACCDEALKIDSRLAPVWSNKSDCLTALGRHEEAVACCDRALQIDPKNEAAWFNRGVGLAALARHEEAIVCFDEALNLDPRLAAAWSRKGNSLVLLHRPEDALGCYARAVRIDPRDAAAWYNKALREEACDRPEEAIASYRQFLAVAPAQRAELIAAAQAKIEALGGTVACSS